MSLKAFEERVTELENAIAQSLANHNALLGRLAEAQHLLSVATTVVEDVAPVVEAVAPLV